MSTVAWTEDSLKSAIDMHRAQACSMLVSAFWNDADGRDETGRYMLDLAVRHARAADKLSSAYHEMLIEKMRGFRLAREQAA